jgi:hypothetical protein
MSYNYLDAIKEIENYKDTTAYVGLLNYFKEINFAFPTCDIKDHTFYRVRFHKENEEFFNNESELSYIRDILKIKDFSRCNEPLQSMFYCSDNSELSFKEVAKGIEKTTLEQYRYYTVSSWKLVEEICVAYFLENNFTGIFNTNMLKMRQAFDRVIDDNTLIGDKHELKEFLLQIYGHFKRPFSINDNAYYLSAAFTNYLFNTINIDDKKIDGFVYPTCLGSEFENLGLNYVFAPGTIGKGKKIQMTGACRISTTNSNNKIMCKGIDKSTGHLLWVTLDKTFNKFYHK